MPSWLTLKSEPSSTCVHFLLSSAHFQNRCVNTYFHAEHAFNPRRNTPVNTALLSCASKWCQDEQVHCVQCHSLFQSLFSYTTCTVFFKELFFYLFAFLFTRLRYRYFAGILVIIFLCLWLISWRRVQLHGFGCFCPTITSSVEMKGTNWIALASNVTDFRNNPALLLSNYNNTLVSSCLLAAPHLYAL